MLTRTFEASISNLDKIMTYLREFLSNSALSEKRSKQFEVALEEAVVNIIKYAYQHPSGVINVSCGIDVNGKVASVRLCDSGTPFNPLEKAECNPVTDLETQPIGGLGIHFIRRMCDSVAYEFLDKTNNLTMYMNLTAQES